MSYFVTPIAKLIEEFEKLPGIGPKSAQRLAFYVVNLPPEKALKLANAIKEAKEKVKYCSVCGNLTDKDPCMGAARPPRDIRWPPIKPVPVFLPGFPP